MARGDPAVKAHLEWIGFVQPTDLEYMRRFFLTHQDRRPATGRTTYS